MARRLYTLGCSLGLLSLGACAVDNGDPAQGDFSGSALEEPTSEPPEPPVTGSIDQSYPLQSARWTSFPIDVCWEEPSSPERDQARAWMRMKIASELERRTNVRFAGWGVCPSGTFEGIRITHTAAPGDDAPHSKGLGKNIGGKRNGLFLPFDYSGLPNFANCMSSEEARRRCVDLIALHEFGHAIGLAHEHKRDDGPMGCTATQGNAGDTKIGEWDADSAMNYCGSKWNNEGRLSYGDLLGIESMYGAAPRVHNELAGLVTLRSRNFLDRAILHRNYLVELEPLDQASALGATFRVAPGLAAEGYVSLEAVSHPGHFLRHSNFGLVLAQNDGSRQFAEDATFAPKLGLADNNQISFESFNFPALVIQHDQFHMILGPALTDQQKENATFLINAPAQTGVGYQLRAANLGNQFVRHEWFVGRLTELSTDVERLSATFYAKTQDVFHPFMSFEGVGFANQFLRHSNFAIRLDAHDGSELFTLDSSFRVRPALNNDVDAVSLESRNFPNHFLRHRNHELFVEPGDNAQFKNDASFFLDQVPAP